MQVISRSVRSIYRITAVVSLVVFSFFNLGLGELSKMRKDRPSHNLRSKEARF